MDAGRSRRGDKLPQPRAGRLPAAEKGATVKKDGGSKKKEEKEDLLSGWVRVESRSKPGAFFYAHPATKRTQAHKPGSERKIGPERPGNRDQRKVAEAKGSARRSADTKAVDVEVPDPPAPELVVDLEEEAETAAAKQDARANARRNKALAEAEAEEAAREERLQKVRERRARAAQADREELPVELPEGSGSASASASASVSVAAKAPADKSRRAGVRSGVGSGGLAKKRRKEWKKDASEADEGVTQEDLERWKEDNDWRETSTENASDADSEEKEEVEGPRREAIPAPEQIFEPCLDVLKSGLWVERHPLVGPKEQWLLGRAATEVDVPMQHESISRNHATVIRQSGGLFIADLGSAHGSLLDGRRLMTNTLVKLHSGAQLRFGASTRLYVFYEPAPASSLPPPRGM